MAYYVYGNDGAKYGPVELDGLRQWVSEQRIVPTTTLEDVATGATVQASQVPGLFPTPTSAPSGVSQPGPYNQSAEGPYAQNPYGPNAQYPRGNFNQAPINNHLPKAIFCTLCCCLIGGIVAIIHSSKVSSLQAAGDYQGAQAAADTADKWANWSIGIGLVLNLISLALQAMLASQGQR